MTVAGAIIVQGDCFDVELPRDRFQLVYADPPFGRGVKRTGKAGGYDDTLVGPDYLAWVTERIARWADHISDGWLCVHHDPVVGAQVAVVLSERFGQPEGIVAWQDAWVSGFRSRAKFWPRVHDTLTFWKVGNPPFAVTTEAAPEGYERRGGGGNNVRSVGDVWVGPWSPGHLSFSKEKVGWPDQKPVALLDRIIAATTQPGDLVADPFTGSGTTGVAAIHAGRGFFGSEATNAGFAIATGRLFGFVHQRCAASSSCHEDCPLDDGRAVSDTSSNARPDAAPIDSDLRAREKALRPVTVWPKTAASKE